MGMDKFQQKAIDISLNAVVSAGAGSGKTTVLSQRYLHLVQDKGLKVEEILTLTFTKKATVEMSSRIYRVLKNNNSPEAGNFYKAQIKTLDSYCSSVAKLGSRFYGITPDFTLDDEAVYENARALALPFLLEHRDNKCVKDLLQTKNYSDFAEECFVNTICRNSTVSDEIDFDACFDLQVNEICGEWNKKSNDILSSFESVKNEINIFEGKKDGKVYLKFLDALDKTGSLESVEFAKEDLLNDRENVLSKMLDFYNKVSVLGSVPHTGMTSSAYEPLKNAHNEFRNLFKELRPLINFVYGLDYTKDLMKLLKEFQDKINHQKRLTGILTFKDVSNLALHVLKEFPEIRKVEKQKYKAIMIDEFQDNNSDQRDMLFLLAENLERMEKSVPAVEELCKDKLFFVGDEKQSIYKFRGADVSVFNSLSKDFIDGNLSMSTNYRSVPSLIASFNTIFGGEKYLSKACDVEKPASAFYTQEMQSSAKVPDYEAVYHSVTFPETVDLEKEDFSPRVHYALYRADPNEDVDEAKTLTGEEAEAYWVCNKIRELTLESKKYSPSEIAVLFRSNSHQAVYEKTLLGMGIPYSVENLTGFFSDGPVNDIYSILRICDFEYDQMCYARVLESPLVNLSFEDVALIFEESKIPFAADGLQLSQESLARYNEGKNIFLKLKELSKTASLTDLISYIWYDCGYRYETMWNQSVENFGKMYDYLFELAREAQLKKLSLASFIDSLKFYAENPKKSLENMEIPLESSGGVHLMTIHKSKGLQFKVVFVVETNKKTGSDSNSQPIFASREYGITVNTPICPEFNKDSDASKSKNYFYNKIKEIEDKKAAAELRRVVYVALTRAEKELYITNGNYSLKGEDYRPGALKNPVTIFNVLENGFSDFLDEEDNVKPGAYFDLEYIPNYERDFVISSGRKNTETDKEKFVSEIVKNKFYENADVIEKDSVSQNYTSPSRLYEKDEELTESVTEKVPYKEIDDLILSCQSGKTDAEKDFVFGANNFGTIVHAYMESAVSKKVFSYSAKELLGLKNEEKNIPVIHEACKKMGESFFSSDLGKRVLDSGEKYCEYNFKSYIGNKIIKGTMDLVFKSADATWTVVDYKTNRIIEPKIYIGQLACYRTAIAEMLGVNAAEIKCCLFYLRYGKEVDVTEECNSLDIEKLIQEKI